MSLNWKARALVVLVTLVGTVAVLSSQAFAQQPGFRNTGDMTFSRVSFASAVLADGRVLVVSDNTAELYDPVANTFSFFAVLPTSHGSGLTATRLADGRVLVVGGQVFDSSVASAELFDPVSGTFAPTGSMATPRGFHTATRLADGRVLVTGGHRFNATNSAVDSAEVYDPGTGTFASVGSMSVARDTHTATLLPDGRVLVVGGYGTTSIAQASAETFDPVTAGFTPTAGLTAGRGDHTATMLANGTVLVAGGHVAAPDASLDTAEIYDPVANTFTPTGNMTVARGAHAASTLADGRVFIAGGYTAFPFLGSTLASAELYDPGTGTFEATASMPNPRGRFIAVRLASGEVLVAGGSNVCCVGMNQAEVFTLNLVDTQPPVISVPSDFSVIAQDAHGAFVSYNVFVTDDIDAQPELECTPHSGTVFPLGTTTVVCTATDDASNVGTASFNVTVIEPLALTATLSATGNVDSNSGIAVLSGTVSCSRTTQFLNLFGELSQVISNRAVVSGSFFAQASCAAGAPATWSATVAPSSGRFKAGKATASMSAFACDTVGSCASAAVAPTAVQLRGKK